MKTLKVGVLCAVDNGLPDIVFFKIGGTEDQYAEGLFYEQAKEETREHGYEEPMIAFDETDFAFSHLKPTSYMRYYILNSDTID